jgi:alanyl-tRNA synthetase
MTSSQIRQSFLDFFKSKQHTLVPSSSLLPDSPNLLFTNAGMNQFVPIFLGQTKCPYKPGRAADTQKCIRAGGKHNDLEDVGLDTYHHTFFEMLGNWSFGDYFKKEAIEWAWELVTGVWKFPKDRLYATVYKPGPGDPSEFDQEVYNHWARLFTAAGLDPAVHIVHGGKKDNFWMMGDTGPCGPCSELHVDLTPAGDTKGSLVNKGDARCIEIWNLVFIQFNANPDGTFSPLPAKHVDTGMGFERVTSIIQCTENFKDFAGAKISNYETDIFRPIFDALEKLSGKKYGSTLPNSNSQPSTLNPQQSVDIAFRVIADHIRTLGFAIADGIQPGNNDRNYVLRRILRRAVRYGRTLGFHEPFFYKLVDVLADTMGDVFPEIRARKKQVQETIQREEEAFNKTLDRGIEQFDFLLWHTIRRHATEFPGAEKARVTFTYKGSNVSTNAHLSVAEVKLDLSNEVGTALKKAGIPAPVFAGAAAFELYDTYGFPLDLTELMARERGLTVDTAGFEKLMEEQRARARAAQKKEVISLSQIETTTPTKFVGYENLAVQAKVLEVVSLKGWTPTCRHPRHQRLLRRDGRSGRRHRRIGARQPALASNQYDEIGEHLAPFDQRRGNCRRNRKS